MAKSKKPRKHVGQWIDVDGQPFHVLATPDMTPELRDALADLVRCVNKMMDEGTLPKRKRKSDDLDYDPLNTYSPIGWKGMK